MMSREIDPIWILLFDALFPYKGDFLKWIHC